LEIEVPANKDK